MNYKDFQNKYPYWKTHKIIRSDWWFMPEDSLQIKEAVKSLSQDLQDLALSEDVWSKRSLDKWIKQYEL